MAGILPVRGPRIRKQRRSWPLLWIALATIPAPAGADEVIYDDELAPGWEDYSWDALVDLASTTLVHDGAASIQVQTTAWGALSLYRATPFGDAGVLRFWLEGDAPELAIVLEATGEGYQADPIVPLELDQVVGGSFSEILVDLEPLGAHDWTRVTWQDASGFGVQFRVDRVELLDEPPTPEAFTGAMPVTPDRLLLLGGGDVDAVTVRNNGDEIGVAGSQVSAAPHRVYLELGESLVAGSLTVETADGLFTRTVVAGEAAVGTHSTHDISPWIYGMAHAPDPDYVETHGISLARWGGNTSSLYNPLGHYANTGNDWYFENFVLGSAEEWMGWMEDGGAGTFLSVPALDWVARDGSSYSYSVAEYGPQEEVDPFLPDAGNGVREDGTPITWNDPADAATPWDPEDARTWLAGLSVTPRIAAVDNELDIAAQTHRDVHPDPATYDELLERYLATAGVIRDELPGTEIAGLSSCCWWTYWNSDAGDKPAHGGQDFLPWFLDQLAAEEATGGQRLLDILDLHYYPEADVYNDDVDADTCARRLRSTRSLWDPSYTDEGWIGEDVDATQTQPDPNRVQLIPRFRQLIDDTYPGTRLGITEWSFGADNHLSGGLATADALGIFGREQLYLASFWEYPLEGTPAAAAFRLYRDPARPFGSRSLATSVDDPDLLGLFAAREADADMTLVVVNKDPDRDLLLQVDGLPAGEAETRQFGGPLGGTLVAHPPMATAGTLLVPAYSALFLAVADDEPPSDDDTGDDDTGDDDDTSACGGCGCRVGDGALPGGTVVLLALAASHLIRRRTRDHRC